MKTNIYICLIFCLFYFCINEGKIKIIENPELTPIECQEYNNSYGFSFKAEVSGLDTTFFRFLLNGTIDTSCHMYDLENNEIKLFKCLISADHYPLFNEKDSFTLPENVEKFETTEVENWKLYLGKKKVIIGQCRPDYAYSFVSSEKFSMSCIENNNWHLLTLKGTFNKEMQLPQERNYLSEDEYDYYNFSAYVILDGSRHGPSCTIKVVKNSIQNSGNDILECRMYTGIFVGEPLKVQIFTTLVHWTKQIDEEDYDYEYLKLEINDEFNLIQCKKDNPTPSSSSFLIKFNLLLFISLFLI